MAATPGLCLSGAFVGSLMAFFPGAKESARPTQTHSSKLASLRKVQVHRVGQRERGCVTWQGSFQFSCSFWLSHFRVSWASMRLQDKAGSPYGRMGSGDFRQTAPAHPSSLGFVQPCSASFSARVEGAWHRKCGRQAVRISASLLGFACRRNSRAGSFGMQTNLSKVLKAGCSDYPQQCCHPA